MKTFLNSFKSEQVAEQPAETPLTIEECKTKWQEAINDELRSREKRQRNDGVHIHHYNWQGDPVFEPSNTEPEVSLFVIDLDKSNRAVAMRDMERITSITKNAMRYIDPVITLLPGSEIPVGQETSTTHKAKGWAAKFYTIHGSWKYDETERKTAYLDRGDVDQYRTRPSVRIENGFLLRLLERDESMRKAIGVPKCRDRKNGNRRQRRAPVKRPSPLRQCIKASDL
ncbi:uncharacterized protein DSM5745_09993 [Aspergillus mulundensis]|uniref:Uncharacterized protein n=1 Tax=Aspergillus mulundensis TaxID=1810919 RepID=A0A3D8QM59_9EURO|nr:hypothetical protein DSM5745_09993 [Aspergillus mulundensis]RDW62882.1 hypothetical protein DSM5745_09993 [Aspergillus mulundensis]